MAATAQINLGRIDVVYVTDDFADSECFSKGETYTIVKRLPSSPGWPVGLSLSQEGTHFGWVKERDRFLMEAYIDLGRVVECTIVERGKRWRHWDTRLSVNRQWQEGIANCVVLAGEAQDGCE
ncbi:hypothetical protein CONLIGDRAFT_683794 [Coniochaeta ligniaria NRRL 30616]|uniref:Uncharacterized protein n=1 Tax=Coniochaeta ligniaria NRRL 30616 TaxID=1408157 RepID=A0A1J7IHU5_9PEZI|nr:hypothetical protein CONLIGDRAFT_683794 [Coniochaeta ligniaria NRRL 30616]